jgi:manganese oxidase
MRVQNATSRIFAPLAVALIIGGDPSIAFAHELPPPDQLPRYSRYSSTQVFMRGGREAHEGFDAEMARIPGADDDAVTIGRDLDGDGDADEIRIQLEIVEIQEEVYPGEYVTFWVFAPLGRAMSSGARLPSPTIRVEQGDRVKIELHNTHYLPHTIHPHGTIHPNSMDGVPDMTQMAVMPGEVFTYEFVAKNPGTHFYHCHVHPDVHVLMGLSGMLIIEPDRPHNHFAHLIPGAGRIEPMAKATAESYDSEYSLVYMDIDDRLNRIPAAYNDAREIEMRMHRDYDSTQRRANIFLLNGRAFPHTLRDSPIIVRPDEIAKLRILNAGERTIFLHTHGHHPTETDVDGYPVPTGAQITRDTFQIGPAQRSDLALRTGDDDTYASGPGVWLIHDHTFSTQTNKGIAPGGDKTAVIYESFMGEDGLPIGMAGKHISSADEAYYEGARPVFGPGIFNTTVQDYASGWPDEPPAGGVFAYPTRSGFERELPRLDLIDAERHRVAATSCSERPRSFQRIHIKAGREFAREGEVFGFEPRELNVERCQEVELVMENTDSIRHDLMIPGLSPMFALNFVGPGIQNARFVTPDEDVSLMFHCHVAVHDKHGMMGQLIVGAGGEPTRLAQSGSKGEATTYSGVGRVIAALPRMNRLIINHEEIPGFMAAMEMSYPVSSSALLSGIDSGDQIRFTIDPAANQITEIEVLQTAD